MAVVCEGHIDCVSLASNRHQGRRRQQSLIIDAITTTHQLCTDLRHMWSSLACSALTHMIHVVQQYTRTAAYMHTYTLSHCLTNSGHMLSEPLIASPDQHGPPPPLSGLIATDLGTGQGLIRHIHCPHSPRCGGAGRHGHLHEGWFHGMKPSRIVEGL